MPHFVVSGSRSQVSPVSNRAAGFGRPEKDHWTGNFFTRNRSLKEEDDGNRTRCDFYVADGKTVLDLDRCIGCGLCVTTCPTDALRLLRKPKTEQPYVPKDAVDANIRLGQARGKLNAGKLVGMLVKSKVDRLLAPR